MLLSMQLSTSKAVSHNTFQGNMKKEWRSLRSPLSRPTRASKCCRLPGWDLVKLTPSNATSKSVTLEKSPLNTGPCFYAIIKMRRTSASNLMICLFRIGQFLRAAKATTTTRAIKATRLYPRVRLHTYVFTRSSASCHGPPQVGAWWGCNKERLSISYVYQIDTPSRRWCESSIA